MSSRYDQSERGPGWAPIYRRAEVLNRVRCGGTDPPPLRQVQLNKRTRYPNRAALLSVKVKTFSASARPCSIEGLRLPLYDRNAPAKPTPRVLRRSIETTNIPDRRRLYFRPKQSASERAPLSHDGLHDPDQLLRPDSGGVFVLRRIRM
jgi:hypothetical protein